MNVHIKIKSSRGELHQVITMDAPYTIGRGTQANCQLNEPKISTKHCSLQLSSTRLEVFDLDSKNGTYINDLKISKSNLYIGDTLRIGDFTITIDPSKMDLSTIKKMTFHGGNRAESNLLVDKEIDHETVAIAKGIIRKVKTKEISDLTPSQMRNKYKNLYYIGMFINLIFLIILTFIPIHFIKSSLPENQMKTFVFAEFGIVAMFYIINFKMMKFSIGEKFSGLEKKNIIQD